MRCSPSWVCSSIPRGICRQAVLENRSTSERADLLASFEAAKSRIRTAPGGRSSKESDGLSLGEPGATTRLGTKRHILHKCIRFTSPLRNVEGTVWSLGSGGCEFGTPVTTRLDWRRVRMISRLKPENVVRLYLGNDTRLWAIRKFWTSLR